eukprot:scaffold17264_cov61-Cyclotella_meneghiniana.AAC.2
MPALELISCGKVEGKKRRSLTTRPFAGDDLHVLCAIHGIYRAVQMICGIPCWIKLFLFRLDGGVDVNGKPEYCEDALDTTAAEYYNPLSQLEEDDEVLEYIDQYEVVTTTMASFLILSIFYTVLDLTFSMGIVSAANVGTPTDSGVRDGIMRTLLWVKVTFINLILLGAFSAGIGACNFA